MKTRIHGRLIDALEPRRLMAYGDPISTFGVAGQVALRGGISSPRAIVVDSTGRLIVGGSGAIVRVSSAGVNDSSFGTSGKISITANFVDEALDSSGNLYLLVTASAGAVLVRYTANGKMDSTYATGGTALVTGDKSFQPQALTIGADNKPVIAGVFSTDSGNGTRGRVYRLTTAGKADTGFDKDGVVDVKLGSTTFLTPTVQDQIAEVRVVSGKILLSGISRAWSPADYDSTGNYTPEEYGNLYVAAARLTSTGALDSTYAGGGVSRQIAADAYSGTLRAAGAIDSAGNVVTVAGIDSNDVLNGYSRSNIVAAKFNTGGGKVYLSTASNEIPTNAPLDAKILSDGRAVVLGQSSSSQTVLSTLEITTTGAMRQYSFASDSDPSTPDLSTYYYDGKAALAVAADGKLILAGVSSTDSTTTLMKVDSAASSSAPGHFANARANQVVRDSKGGLHFAYYDQVTMHLMYAYRSPSGAWGTPVTVDSGAFTGTEVSLDLDSLDRPGIAYLDSNAADLKLATFDGSKWTLRNVDSKGAVGFGASFQFTDADGFAISYYSRTAGDLRYALFKDNAWTIETVESDGDTGKFSSLAINPLNRKFGIAYYKPSTKQVRFAYRGSDKKWKSEVVATTTAGADYISLDFSAGYGSPYIAWYDDANADLKVSTRSNSDTSVASAWTNTNVATAGSVGKYCHIRAGYYGDWSIVAWDETNDDLVLYRSYGSSTVLAGGGRYAAAAFGDYQIDVTSFDAGKGDLRVATVV